MDVSTFACIMLMMALVGLMLERHRLITALERERAHADNLQAGLMAMASARDLARIEVQKAGMRRRHGDKIVPPAAEPSEALVNLMTIGRVRSMPPDPRPELPVEVQYQNELIGKTWESGPGFDAHPHDGGAAGPGIGGGPYDGTVPC